LPALLLLSACAVNPVTGEKELSFVSEAQELEAGRSQYAPSRQMQGGDYRLDPALTHYVNEVGQRLAAVSDRRLPYEFKVINDSTPNAWALPGGKIAVNRGLLLELESEAELAAVLGHEIVHAAARHGAKGMERGMILQGAVLVAGVAAGGGDYADLAVGSAALGANLLNQRYSRDAEREADHYGIQYMVRAGYDPLAAVRLQETFVRLAENRQESWLAGLFASHPPSRERVEHNRELVSTLGARGGELGVERYRQMTAGLRHSREAYKALADGRKALAKGELQQAMALADRAIRLEPREALFYGLRGDVFYKQAEYPKAREDYDQALVRDPDFFRHNLQRGLVREKLRDVPGAERDLQRSIELLPTATAYHGLGQLALDAGRREDAKGYFRKAAGSGSEAGKAAAEALVRLDLPDNPGRYLKTGLVLDRSGRLGIRVLNNSRLPVRNLRLSLGLRGAMGRLNRPRVFRLGRVVAPGGVGQIGTDIGPLDSREQLKAWELRLLHAEVAE
jgi:predicted Zn-dependent protease